MEIFSKHEITPHSYVSSLLRRPLSSSSAPHHLILSILHTFLLNYKIMARLLISNLCSFFFVRETMFDNHFTTCATPFFEKKIPRTFWHFGNFKLDFPHFLTFGKVQFGFPAPFDCWGISIWICRTFWHLGNFNLSFPTLFVG